VGTYFGIRAIQDHDSPEAPGNAALNSQAGTAADTSTVTMLLGLAGVGVGTFLWFFRPGPGSDSKPVAVVPTFAPGRGGVEVTGRF
jgi:hypothetical protein